MTPKDLDELRHRAMQLAGLTLAELAPLCHSRCPTSLHRAKGWLGQVIERFLGTDAANQALPDFCNLGVELKTLPLNAQGLPKESTYVTYAPIPFEETQWAHSTVYKKLKHVLWVPYFAQGPIEQRVIGQPFLYQLSEDDNQQLKQDWLELTHSIRLHQFEALNAKTGRWLHIRPKAAHSKTFIRVLGSNNEYINVVPKGFYLRTDFTKFILKQTFSV